MDKRMLLKLKYNNGDTYEMLVDYVRVENNKLYFTEYKQGLELVTSPSFLGLDNLISFDVRWLKA